MSNGVNQAMIGVAIPGQETATELRTGGRTFSTGAYRDTAEGKLDYEAFLSPVVLTRYAQYMQAHCKQSNGQIRSGDDWQKGIPQEVYMKSLLRHLIEVWTKHRDQSAPVDIEEALCAVLFNAQGYLLEQLRKGSTCE